MWKSITKKAQESKIIFKKFLKTYTMAVKYYHIEDEHEIAYVKKKQGYIILPAHV